MGRVSSAHITQFEINLACLAMRCVAEFPLLQTWFAFHELKQHKSILVPSITFQMVLGGGPCLVRALTTGWASLSIITSLSPSSQARRDTLISKHTQMSIFLPLFFFFSFVQSNMIRNLTTFYISFHVLPFITCPFSSRSCNQT